MHCAHLSDTELLRLVRQGLVREGLVREGLVREGLVREGLVRHGEQPSFPALQELEGRHFAAVRAFAAICAANPAAARELGQQSWAAALRQQEDAGAGGAIRPWSLSSVLHTASGWARGNQRVALNPDLAAWTGTSAPAAPGASATAGIRRPSHVARAFAGLTPRSQTILWHRAVEHDDSALTGQLSGVDAGDVPALTGRARRELHDSYVQVLQDGMRDECRRYHRLTLAYADTRSADVAAEVAPHLERCARCSRAVDDIGRVLHDCGPLLAQALLPWGSAQYAARPRTREGLVQGPVETAGGRTGARAAGTGRHAAPRAADAAAHTTGWARADLIVRCTAVAGVCAVGAVFAFAGGPTRQESQANVLSPAAGTPGPARATAMAKSTQRPPSKPDSKPPSKPAGSKPAKSDPAPPERGRARPSSPSVGDAVVEWLFDKVDAAGVTPDSSDNGKDGTLFGATRPGLVNGGALTFDGQQFVTSAGPLLDTAGSFSVSARVKLDRTDVSQTVVSQDASDSSAFLLQYDADESQWELRLPEADRDDADGDADEAGSKSGAVAGEWTQLTGVYDDADDEVRLYVDGRLADTADREEDFASRGSFVVGRGLSGNELLHGVDGTIDDVRAFDRALSSAEAKSLAGESR